MPDKMITGGGHSLCMFAIRCLALTKVDRQQIGVARRLDRLENLETMLNPSPMASAEIVALRQHTERSLDKLGCDSFELAGIEARVLQENKGRRKNTGHNGLRKAERGRVKSSGG